jgi:hypothetical protein
MPLAEYIQQLLAQINIRRTIGLVAKAEEELGGRFADDAVLYLALSISISALRVQGGHHLIDNEHQLDWLESLQVWPVATFIAGRLERDLNSFWKPGDVASITVKMIAAPRNVILPGEIEGYDDFTVLIERLLEYISQTFEISKLRHDRTLQNGLLTYIVPACYRQRFQVWFPEISYPSGRTIAC